MSIKMIRFCVAQAYIALVRRVEFQTQFSRCESLLRTHGNFERSSEHETRFSLSYLVTSREHNQDINKLTISKRVMHLKSWLKPISKNVRSLPVQNSCFVYQHCNSRFHQLALSRWQNYQLHLMTWPIDKRRGYRLIIPNKFDLCFVMWTANRSILQAALKSKEENVTPTNKCVTSQLNNCQSYPIVMPW